MKWQAPRMARNLDDRITGFQVLGERSSGTNFVARLLEANLAPAVPELRPYGWPHGFIDRRVAAMPGLLTVVVYRHPLRWLPSVHRRPLDLAAENAGLSFGAFIRAPWRGAFVKPWGEEVSTADLEPKTGRTFENPMRLRSAKIRYLEEMAAMPGQVAFVRFEDANRDPRATIDALAGGFALSPGPFRPVDTFKGKFNRRYVPRPLPAVSAEDRAFIRGELDLPLEAQIGYRPDRVPRFDGLPPWDARSLRSLALGALPRQVSPR